VRESQSSELFPAGPGGRAREEVEVTEQCCRHRDSRRRVGEREDFLSSCLSMECVLGKVGSQWQLEFLGGGCCSLGGRLVRSGSAGSQGGRRLVCRDGRLLEEGEDHSIKTFYLPVCLGGAYPFPGRNIKDVVNVIEEIGHVIKQRDLINNDTGDVSATYFIGNDP
jgi:hypothetical protein